VQRYNGPGNSFDAASSVAVSPGGGRVFVTGESQGARSSLDYATVAYSAVTGARLWTARYNGPGNGNDAASSVAVSPRGRQVFVTGASQGTRSGPDYVTVAYSAATGARLWVQRYNGPGNGNDTAYSIAVSPDGRRVFVTGASRGATTTGYLTVAYSTTTGARLWVQRYNGPGNGNDTAYSIAVSPDGRRVFVTGASRGTRSGPDYATVAYSAATGARLWVQRYNGPGNGSDEAYSVAVSPGWGRVFVTGASRGTRSGPDYATVAYSAATGARLWVTRYNGPATYDDAARSVAVSPSGSTVYVTGGSNPGSATLAYSAATGALLWLARHSDMLLAGVAVSPGGSRVYVTGLTGPFPNDYATVAHSAG
jgi:WD40 repeat protein